MVRDPLSDTDDPDLETVVGTLDDEDCRNIVRQLDEPRTASELVERCDIPRSTLYRKLDRLTESTLLREGTEIRQDGSHAGRYEVDFTEVIVECDDDREFGIEIERPARRADERLAELWSEVGKEVR
ncbi:helix-turn-helix domain-containing protein [Natronomonas sp. CBA1123]|jgi:DNA-binding transcriptional ArsR family regulator|uniref:winged helix-turn-helix domain-containing protein n=1 Tax=Natronomonas TaxID=63743 RepID=UPI0012EA9E21|nr:MULTISPECIES: helix-turn-helix domain-containing protein [Natronomonas]MUV85052.1 helix-turn-helix domain-containing protein [Natronomonas sp. CBA1123]